MIYEHSYSLVLKYLKYLPLFNLLMGPMEAFVNPIKLEAL